MAAKRTASRAGAEGDGSRQSGSGKATKRSTGSTAASKTSAKATTKKATAKKAPAKKATPKKTPASKPAAKKASASSSGRSTTKATARTKAAAPPRATKRAAEPAKTSTPDRATAKRATGKKVSTKKTTTNKTTAKKAAKDTPAPRPGTVTVTKAKARSLPVLDGEDPWTTAELAEVKDELAADVAKLQSEIDLAEEGIAGLMQDAGDQSGDDEADAGAKTFEREQEISLANNSRDLLDQSHHALERIEDGTYGTCESCGSPIGKLRLQAFPRATLCMTCKRKQERR